MNYVCTGIHFKIFFFAFSFCHRRTWTQYFISLFFYCVLCSQIKQTHAPEKYNLLVQSSCKFSKFTLHSCNNVEPWHNFGRKLANNERERVRAQLTETKNKLFRSASDFRLHKKNCKLFLIHLIHIQNINSIWSFYRSATNNDIEQEKRRRVLKNHPKLYQAIPGIKAKTCHANWQVKESNKKI